MATTHEIVSFRESHLSPRSIQKALHRAMDRAGVSTRDLEVVSHCDRTDPWADLNGVRVVCRDDETRARATAWIAKSLGPKVVAYRRLGSSMGIQASIYTEDHEKGIVLFTRWSLGD